MENELEGSEKIIRKIKSRVIHFAIILTVRILSKMVQVERKRFMRFAEDRINRT